MTIMKAIGYISIVLAAFCTGVFVGLKGPIKGRMQEAAVLDTLVVRDTVTHDRPVYFSIRQTDTMLVAVLDTVVVRDTVFVMLPREQKVYEDSTYRAVVSGYRPSLDAISIYPETRYITETRYSSVPSWRRWGIGVQVGYGVHLHEGQACLAPYFGVGISYNIVSFGKRRSIPP